MELCSTFTKKFEITWPPKSPNLNPIEITWSELNHRGKAKGPTSNIAIFFGKKAFDEKHLDITVGTQP